MTVFNKDAVDYHNEPLFFGKTLNIARFDTPARPVFDKLDKHMRTLFWTPEEVNLSKDIADWKVMNDVEKFIFTQNISYQTLLDSVAGRSASLAFLPHVTDPSLESCILAWSFFESIHSRSYSYVIRNLYPNPKQVFDDIMLNEAITDRALSLTKYIDAFIANPKPRELYLALVAFNVLEGLRFYTSFACTFALAENKKLEGSAKIIKLIARDEAQHLSIVQHIIKDLRKMPDFEGIIDSCKDDVLSIYNEAVTGEKEWANHLFQHGSIIGLNASILHQYIEHLANKRMRAIGYDPIFQQPWNKNPLPWIEPYFSSAAVQVAPMEVELSSYLGAGALDNNLSNNDFDDLSLDY